MTIAGVSNASSSSAASSAAGISALVAQEAKIDAEISKTSNDKSLDAKSKAAKIQALQAQQAQLQAQIDQCRREIGPDIATGGRCCVATLTRDSITTRMVGELGTPTAREAA